MNGIHDMGGMQCFGRIERDELAWHEPWEPRVNAVMRASIAAGLYNLDEFRWAIERMDPVRYLQSSYYQRWLASVERNLIEKGVLTTQEIEARMAALSTDPQAPRPTGDDAAVRARLASVPRHGAVPVTDAPRFALGDRVRARNVHPSGHTRLPRYVRGKQGVVTHILYTAPLPDTNGMGLGPNPGIVYSVRFAARELWGESAETGQTLQIELWESYLEPAAPAGGGEEASA